MAVKVKVKVRACYCRTNDCDHWIISSLNRNVGTMTVTATKDFYQSVVPEDTK